MKNHKITVKCDFTNLLKPSVFNKSFKLKNSEIVIYKIHIPDYISLIHDLSLLLNEKEIIRAEKYYKVKDRNRFIICRSLLKLILANYTKLNISQIQLDYNTNKKPYLAYDPSLFFNVTHSEDYGLIAISNKSVGIDIECINKDDDFINSLLNIFNEKEHSFIKNAFDKKNAFMSLWTRKEAFVKATGKGIDDDFSKIPCIDGLHILDESIIKNKKNWETYGFEINSNYVGAISYEKKSPDFTKILMHTLPNTLESLMVLSKNNY